MSIIDLSQPLSDVLREGTKKAHDEVNVSPVALAMTRGELDKEEYIRFLMMLWHIYDTFERALEQHQQNPVLEPTYNPTLLARAPALSADIAHLLGVPESAWKSHRIHIQLTAPGKQPPALTSYVSRIQSIADSPDPAPLLAHAYVRYLGDLSGGQNIQRALGKAYDLSPGGAGLSFYRFKELHSSKQAGLGEMKRIKDWFRKGMNEGAGDNQDVKGAIMDEASRVFELNGELFKAVNIDASTTSSSDSDASRNSISSQLEDDEEEGTGKSKVVYTNPEAGDEPRTYSVASVAAVILAVCLAHFFLTVGGFTGEKGYDKLVKMEEWLDSLRAGA